MDNENKNNLGAYVSADVREDIKIAGATIKQFSLIIIPMFILGIVLFTQLPGSALFRFIVFVICGGLGFYIVLADVFYKRKVKRRYKKAKENLDTENIQFIKEYQGAFMVFEDQTVGACIQIDVSPWEASPVSAKRFDTVIFKSILRLCALNKFELISIAENKIDNSKLDKKYKNLYDLDDPLYKLGEARNKKHEWVQSQYGRKTYYIWRVRQLESKRNVKESIKDVTDIVHEIILELSKIGAVGITLGEDEIKERTELMLLPEGNIYKPLFMEDNLLQKAIGEILSTLRLIKITKFDNRHRPKDTIDKTDPFESNFNYDEVDPREIHKI